MKKALSKTFLLLFLIVLLGSILRFYHLGKEELWLDEIFTTDEARQSIYHLLPQVFENDTIFPLYSILAHFSLRLLGESAVSVRLPACIFGILAIPLFFLLGKKLFDEQTGLVCAFLLSISPYHIFYSQEARPYSLQVFLLIGMIYFFIRILQSNDALNWSLFLVFEILAIYAHWYSGIMVATLLIYYVWKWFHRNENIKVHLTQMVIIQIIVLLAVAPWIMTFGYYKPWLKNTWIPRTKPMMILDTFVNFSTSLTNKSFSQNGLPSEIVWLGSIFFGISILLYLIYGYKVHFSKTFKQSKGNRNFLYYFPLVLFILPMVIMYFYSLKVHSFLSYRYLIIALPGFYLVSGNGLISLIQPRLKIFIIIAVACVYGFCLHDYYSISHKTGLKRETEYIQQHYEQDDAIMIVPFYWVKALLHYCPNAKNLILPQNPNKYDSSELVKTYARIWLIEVIPYTKPFPQIDYYQKQEIDFKNPNTGVRLTLFKIPTFTLVQNFKLDLGTQESSPYLLKGLYNDETSGDGKTFVWSQGEQSEILLPLKPDKSYKLQLQVMPFVYPHAPLQTIKLYINKTFLESTTLPNEWVWQDIHVHLPMTALNSKENILELEYSRVTAPRDVILDNPDTRKIAIAYKSLLARPE